MKSQLIQYIGIDILLLSIDFALSSDKVKKYYLKNLKKIFKIWLLYLTVGLLVWKQFYS